MYRSFPRVEFPRRIPSAISSDPPPLSAPQHSYVSANVTNVIRRRRKFTHATIFAIAKFTISRYLP